MKNRSILFMTAALALAGAPQLHAQLLDASFTSGFSGWTVLGDPQVLTTTGTLPSNQPTPAAPGGGRVALIQSSDGDTSHTVTAATLAAGLGLSSGLPATESTDPNDPNFGGPYQPEDGQGIVQSFAVAATTTLSFQWAFQTNDNYGFDEVGYVLDGVYHELAAPTNVYPTSAPLDATDWATVTLTLNTGSHTLGFVAYNTSTDAYYSTTDTFGPTALLVTNIAVPEPGEWLLLGLGVLALATGRTLRRRML